MFDKAGQGRIGLGLIMAGGWAFLLLFFCHFSTTVLALYTLHSSKYFFLFPFQWDAGVLKLCYFCFCIFVLFFTLGFSVTCMDGVVHLFADGWAQNLPCIVGGYDRWRSCK